MIIIRKVEKDMFGSLKEELNKISLLKKNVKNKYTKTNWILLTKKSKKTRSNV